MVKNPQYRRIAIDTLCQVMQEDSSAKNRRDAAKALAVYGEDSIPCLCQALKQENNSKVRSQIISSLKKLGYTEEKTMSETPKYNFPNAQNIQIVEHTDGGDVIAHPSPPSTTVMHFHDKVYGVAGNVEGNLQVNPNSATTEIDETSNS